MHDITLELQNKIEALELVERAFVHADCGCCCECDEPARMAAVLAASTWRCSCVILWCLTPLGLSTCVRDGLRLQCSCGE